MNKRKVAIFTGNRAEYGLLKHLALSITKEEQLELSTYSKWLSSRQTIWFYCK